MKVEAIRYTVSGAPLAGALVYDPAVAKGRSLLMAPNWLCVGPEALDRGRLWAGRGYVVFVADMYREGIRPRGPKDAAMPSSPTRSPAGYDRSQPMPSHVTSRGRVT